MRVSDDWIGGRERERGEERENSHRNSTRSAGFEEHLSRRSDLVHSNRCLLR